MPWWSHFISTQACIGREENLPLHPVSPFPPGRSEPIHITSITPIPNSLLPLLFNLPQLFPPPPFPQTTKQPPPISQPDGWLRDGGRLLNGLRNGGWLVLGCVVLRKKVSWEFEGFWDEKGVFGIGGKEVFLWIYNSQSGYLEQCTCIRLFEEMPPETSRFPTYYTVTTFLNLIEYKDVSVGISIHPLIYFAVPFPFITTPG